VSLLGLIGGRGRSDDLVELLLSAWLVHALFARSGGGGQAQPQPQPQPKPPPPGVSTWSDADMAAFVATVTPIIGDPSMALAVYQVESGNNPRAINPTSNATGLPQFMPQYLPNYGWTGTPQDFANLGVQGQLPFIAQLLLGQVTAMGGRPTSRAQLYHANFYPATLKQPYVVRAASSGGSAQEDQAYQANKLLDANNDGTITEADLERTIANATSTPRYKALLAQLQHVLAASPATAKKPAPAAAKPVSPTSGTPVMRVVMPAPKPAGAAAMKVPAAGPAAKPAIKLVVKK